LVSIFQDLGKVVIIFGAVLVLIGILLYWGDKIPFLGKLPGDILIKKGNFTFFAPIATSIVISLVLTILLNLFLRIKR
jgi:hypothetical protein